LPLTIVSVSPLQRISCLSIARADQAKGPSFAVDFATRAVQISRHRTSSCRCRGSPQRRRVLPVIYALPAGGAGSMRQAYATPSRVSLLFDGVTFSSCRPRDGSRVLPLKLVTLLWRFRASAGSRPRRRSGRPEKRLSFSLYQRQEGSHLRRKVTKKPV